MIEVQTIDQVEALPDGTIISWLRLPHDPTSEAVAFVRRERDPAEGVSVWISPGGWQPHSVDSVGLTFPVRIIRLGEFNPEHYCDQWSDRLLPLLPSEALTADTAAATRAAALDAAVAFWADAARTPDDVMATAERFEVWLNRVEPTMAGTVPEWDR